MAVILPAFDPRVTIPNTLSGGVNTSDRALLLAQGTAQSRAAQSLDARFAQRIQTALTRYNEAGSSAQVDALVRAQSQLASRKERVNQAIEVVSKALTQIEYLKGHVEYLQDQLDELEAGNTTAAAVAVDWDNKLRKINELAAGAAQTIKDGRSYNPKNLIDSLSRTTFASQTLYAPYSSNGDVIQIDGTYLGTDYFITEDGTGNFWNSDTGFASSEDAVGTLAEYTDADNYPGSPTGTSVSVDAAITAFVVSDEEVNITIGGEAVDGTISRGGLGLLDAFLYANFDTTLGATLGGSNDTSDVIDRAREDLQAAESLLLTTKAEFQTSMSTLQSRVAVFDSLISAADVEVANLIRSLQDDRAAEVLSAELEYTVARFDFTLLAARGNTLVKTLVLAQDQVSNNPFGETTAVGEFVVGATLNVVA